MYRTNTCGELNSSNIQQQVCLCGWVQRIRNLGGMTFIDLRDRYGITQLAFNMNTNAELCEQARKLGREYVIQVKGKVVERFNKNKSIPTGDIEIDVTEINILNASKLPPFTIEDHTDGGDELRMQYRYLDLRRNTVLKNMVFRHQLAIETRNYLNQLDFLEIETPFLIRSTPEGARDFVVPSRLNIGQFYALPQSPQQFKQLLMIAGMDKYFQIVRCFRDEDLRADRQPEFTQIDCEMAFVTQEDIIQLFEKLFIHLFKKLKNIELNNFERISYHDAMKRYGSDKPDMRFDMQFVELNHLLQHRDFKIFNEAELIIGICAKGCGSYTRKQIDELTDFVKRPQIGASGLVYVQYLDNNTFKSSVDKFYTQEDLQNLAAAFNATSGDLLLILSGKTEKTRKALGELRLEMGNRLNLRDKEHFKAVWVVDFPMFEWDEETQRFYAKHHPFTSPKPEDVALLDSGDIAKINANAYDLVINGVEVGGGSIRIHDRDLQKKIFRTLGFSESEAQQQFGFLMNAFEYGAPPHGGIAFGFDRMCAVFNGIDSIRDFIAFPKNNLGRDVMINAPYQISDEQLKELSIQINYSEKDE
ncbi:MAG TPA: aspartate--tRNA ligase [Bacteroidales bacterium]|nr:aspartate--tRNA ligase [Bacteroidales bacterium]HOR82053.1 aspartate--tRNA ligase [Bacteroidales bacterium]HPJ91414.1 aspartate--tRNA ligase [Bacteroidales bacterium]